MKRLTLSAIVLFAVFAGLATPAAAQVRTTPPGKLFFEGDIVKHNLEGQIGPFCVLQSRFMRGEAIAWRMRLALPNGANADDKVVKTLVVHMNSGQTLGLDYGPHGNPPTDFFWANSWKSLMSPPAEKARPSPRITTHRIAGSRPSSIPFLSPSCRSFSMRFIAGEVGSRGPGKIQGLL